MMEKLIIGKLYVCTLHIASFVIPKDEKGETWFVGEAIPLNGKFSSHGYIFHLSLSMDQMSRIHRATDAEIEIFIRSWESVEPIQEWYNEVIRIPFHSKDNKRKFLLNSSERSRLWKAIFSTKPA